MGYYLYVKLPGTPKFTFSDSKRVTSEAGAGKALLRELIKISLVTRVRTPNPPSVRVTDVSASLWRRRNPYADLEVKLVIGSPH